MPHYFYRWDRDKFVNGLRPVFSKCWQERQFNALASWFRDAGIETPADSLISQLHETGFDRGLWRAVVGETLVTGALEVPRLPVEIRTLEALLGASSDTDRVEFQPIQQVLLGSRDLVFGGGIYRPLQAGWNDRDDIVRLAQFLSEINPEKWRVQTLASLTEHSNDEERNEELDDARAAWPELVALYRDAAGKNNILICEVP